MSKSDYNLILWNLSYIDENLVLVYILLFFIVLTAFLNIFFKVL